MLKCWLLLALIHPIAVISTSEQFARLLIDVNFFHHIRKAEIGSARVIPVELFKQAEDEFTYIPKTWNAKQMEGGRKSAAKTMSIAILDLLKNIHKLPSAERVRGERVLADYEVLAELWDMEMGKLKVEKSSLVVDQLQSESEANGFHSIKPEASQNKLESKNLLANGENGVNSTLNGQKKHETRGQRREAVDEEQHPLEGLSFQPIGMIEKDYVYVLWPNPAIQHGLQANKLPNGMQKAGNEAEQFVRLVPNPLAQHQFHKIINETEEEIKKVEQKNPKYGDLPVEDDFGTALQKACQDGDQQEKARALFLLYKLYYNAFNGIRNSTEMPGHLTALWLYNLLMDIRHEFFKNILDVKWSDDEGHENWARLMPEAKRVPKMKMASLGKTEKPVKEDEVSAH